MDKGRLEAFSDGVFAIAMTLLVFNIHVPALGIAATDAQLWAALGNVAPLIIIYAVSFLVMSVLWINHHFIFHTFARSVDRRLNLLNLIYLMLVAFLPFSSSLIGEYWRHQPAGVVYGANLFFIVLLSSAMISYIGKTPGLAGDISARLNNQARFRATVSLLCYLAGIAATFLFIPLSVFLYAFPVIFNILPGSLDATERLFGFSLD